MPNYDLDAFYLNNLFAPLFPYSTLRSATALTDEINLAMVRRHKSIQTGAFHKWLREGSVEVFPSIGDKYAREIPMRSYDPLFRRHFALDHRLNKLLRVHFKPAFDYKGGEEFLQETADELGIDCWALDTILFEHYDEII